MKIKNRLLNYINASIVIITIAIGWKYTAIAFIVPVVMLTAITISLFNGRYHCGNVCPRGQFLNIALPFLSRNGNIPKLLRSIKFRVFMLFVMMGVTGFMVSKNITSANHWGTVFWTMCTVTTGAGVVLGIFFKPRTWCTFCPIGTMQTLARKHHKKLTLEHDNCKVCRLCEKKCPMNLEIIHKDKKAVKSSHDCIKCSECVSACPTKALKLSKTA